MVETDIKPRYEVTGYDSAGTIVFHVMVEAVNDIVAKLYVTAHLQRTADGADALREAAKIEAVIRP